MQIAKEYFLRHFGELVIPVRLRTFFYILLVHVVLLPVYFRRTDRRIFFCGYKNKNIVVSELVKSIDIADDIGHC